MVVRAPVSPRVSSTDFLAERAWASAEVVCPKCLGLGSIVLMRRLAGRHATDVCPTCEGAGRVSRRNGYADPAPATVRGRRG